MIVIGPVLVLGFYDYFQTKRTIVRNFPLFGRGRYVMEALRPKIYQYFVESDVHGTRISRVFRNVIYQRAKGARDTVPFGTEFDVYSSGYEWMDHSLSALDAREMDHDLHVSVWGPDCKQPYWASILNISAMSFGALSRNAILALNGGAKLGGFAHNTGEGSISPSHLEPGGDLIWQVGTGYFGCRTKDGSFCPESFSEKSQMESVKMIEIKLSQGAKPGHGGILPASKNTPEIAQIRAVEVGTEVVSPPAHTASGPHWRWSNSSLNFANSRGGQAHWHQALSRSAQRVSRRLPGDGANGHQAGFHHRGRWGGRHGCSAGGTHKLGGLTHA